MSELGLILLPFYPIPFIPEFLLYSGVIGCPVCYTVNCGVLLRLLPPSLGRQDCVHGVQAHRRQETTCPLWCCPLPLLKLPCCLSPELCISLGTRPLGSAFPRHHLASSLPGSLMSCWQPVLLHRLSMLSLCLLLPLAIHSVIDRT